MARGMPGLGSVSGKKAMGPLILGLGALLGVIGWFTSFVSQCVAESRNHLRTHHVWFTTWVNLALVIAIIYLIVRGSVGFFKPLLIPFLIIAIVMSVLGADQGLYSDFGDLQGMGAGYLIFAIAAIVWLLYLAYAESTESAVTGSKPMGNSFGSVPGMGGGLAGTGNSGIDPSANAGGNLAPGPSASASSGGALGGLRNRFSLGKPKGATSQEAPIGTNDVAMNAMPPSNSMNVPTDVVAHSPSATSNANQMRSVDNSVIPESGPSQHLGMHGAGAPPMDTVNHHEPSMSPSYAPQYMGQDPSMAPPIVGNELAPTNAGMSSNNISAMSGGMVGSPSHEVAAPRLQRAEALYSYKASEDDPTEISFNKGDILEIVDSSGKWWQAYRSNGELGIVPSNYLQML
ncbi:Transmembrane osmosensor [Malassezia yamatoensis]|uniref:Transmembrane osmosensor n=1 Tax=Malassezia yamatoensis TaxID=253288 RepID=A0AAJ5YS97_9BASI|nr:Transmembrane osmosensor [Malassezia yamatoensis]